MITPIVLMTTGALLLGTLTHRWMQVSDRHVRGDLDREIEEVLIRELSQRLPAEEQDLRRAFEGHPSPRIEALLSRHVRQVEITFQRVDASLHELEILLLLDSSRLRHRRAIERDQIPDVVRAEMLRSGASRITIPWDFPWQGSPAATENP